MRYALAAVLLLAASVALALLARSHETFPLDREALDGAQALGRAYQPIAGLTNELNVPIAIAAFAIAAGAMLWRRRPEGVLMIGLALLARSFLDDVRGLIDRARPSGDFFIMDTVGGSSFPSGHVTTAVLCCAFWFVFAAEILPRRYVRRTRIAAVVVPALFAISRMWAGVHWLSDGYGAVLWGLCLVATLLALRPALRRACVASLSHVGWRLDAAPAPSRAPAPGPAPLPGAAPQPLRPLPVERPEEPPRRKAA